MRTMRTICGLNRRDSLRAMLMCIDTIEKNLAIDDKVKSNEYQIIVHHLERLYDDVKRYYLHHVY